MTWSCCYTCPVLHSPTCFDNLALICGTSACHMLASPRPVFVSGVWGPYADVLLPGTWLLEAGQSAVGKLLDHVIETHPCYNSLKARLPLAASIPEELSIILGRRAHAKMQSVASLAKDLHVWPDFHGNRSPLADPNMKGMVIKAIHHTQFRLVHVFTSFAQVSGLVLDTSEDNLAVLYLATVQALCVRISFLLMIP